MHIKKDDTIGVVRTDRIGDVVLTIPLLIELSILYPHNKVILFTSDYAAPIFKNSNISAEIVALNQYFELNKALKDYPCDIVIHVKPNFKEAVSSFISRVPHRIGTAYRWYSILFNHKIYDHRSRVEHHESVYNLRMIEHISSKHYSFQDVLELSNKYSYTSLYSLPNIIVENLSTQYPIVVHPASRGSSKDIDVQNMAEIILGINNQVNAPIVITGVDSEKEICEQLESLIPGSFNACGMMSLHEMISLINTCSLFLSNSTGVLHLAGILQKKVVGFYPNTPVLSSKRWGPLSRYSCIISPDVEQGDNMHSINIQKAIQTILNFLEQKM